MNIEEMLNELENKYRWIHPHTLLRFEVQVAEHCNLNCKNCTHYAPLAKEAYLDVEQYKKDCARLSELFGGEMEMIKLMGGEPLLHPQLTEIMKITRDKFSFGRIKVVTNGVLLPSMGENFWQACREYRVEVTPTKYPVNFDYDHWGEYAASKGVVYNFFNKGAETKRMYRRLLRVRGRYTVSRNFYHCESANRCLTLRNGKLYGCELPAHAHHLKKYFDLDIPLSERNGVDIYDVKDAAELMEKVNRPIPFCRFCNLSSTMFEEDWGPSKRDRYEWIDFEGTEADMQYLRDASSVYLYGNRDLDVELIKSLRKQGVELTAILVGDQKSDIPSVEDIPIIGAEETEQLDKNGVCLLTMQSLGEAEPLLMQCCFRQIIPLFS